MNYSDAKAYERHIADLEVRLKDQGKRIDAYEVVLASIAAATFGALFLLAVWKLTGVFT
jgi:hypothetical protein